MNETSPQNGSLEQEKTTPGLSEPHFDDTSIATARPVEPLVEAGNTSRYGTLTNLLRHFSFSAIAIAAITLAVVLSSFHQGVKMDEPLEAMKPAEESTQPETAVGAIVPEQKSTRRFNTRGIRTHHSQSKPVARKVGTIYYGR